MQKLLPLKKIFFDQKDFAWNLLQAQLKVQLNQQLTPQQITNMLQLYMRGVQKMNSVSDPRESYFTIRVSTLMSRKNVIKALNNKAMTKKKKLGQGQVINTMIHQEKIVLNQKKKELQMRMAYVVEDNHNNQQLKILINENLQKEKKISLKISDILASHEQRLMERIRNRKMKTNTVRSTINQNQQTPPQSNQKTIEEIFNGIDLKTRTKKKIKNQRKCNSMPSPDINTQFYDAEDTPTKSKPRRQTLDLSQL